MENHRECLRWLPIKEDDGSWAQSPSPSGLPVPVGPEDAQACCHREDVSPTLPADHTFHGAGPGTGWGTGRVLTLPSMSPCGQNPGSPLPTGLSHHSALWPHLNPLTVRLSMPQTHWAAFCPSSPPSLLESNHLCTCCPLHQDCCSPISPGLARAHPSGLSSNVMPPRGPPWPPRYSVTSSALLIPLFVGCLSPPSSIILIIPWGNLSVIFALVLRFNTGQKESKYL